MLETMVRIAPSQPSQSMLRIAPRRNSTISLHSSFRDKIPEKLLIGIDSKLFSKVKIDSKKGLGLGCSKMLGAQHRAVTEAHNYTFGVAAISAETPCSVAT
jgi:hypothetical protein